MTEVLGPLGLRVTQYADEPRSLIGDIAQSPAGNVVLRIGREIHGGLAGWEQTDHIVLEPDEARDLATRLTELAS